MLFSLTYLVCCICTGQAKEPRRERMAGNAVTFEAGALIISDDIEIRFTHSISDKWSVSFSTAMSLEKNAENPEMTEHDKSFMEETEERRNRREHRFRNEVAGLFWMKEVLNGPFIGIGAGHDNRMQPEIIVSFGYMFTIYGRFKGCIGYRSEMIRSLRYDDRSGCHITAGLGFSF